jgi:hypothetical protein
MNRRRTQTGADGSACFALRCGKYLAGRPGRPKTCRSLRDEENENMKPIRIEQGRMNRRGQITIPKKIRKIFDPIFQSQGNIPIEIQLFPSGRIQIVPTKILPMSLFMETDDELLKSAVRAHDDKGSESYASESEVEEMLEK